MRKLFPLTIILLAIALAGCSGKRANINSKEAQSPLACALEVAKSVEHPELKSEALINIAKGYLKAGKRGKALKVFERAIEVTKELEGTLTPSWRLLEIADICIEASEKKKAKETLFQAKQIIDKIGDPAIKAGLLTNIASSYFRLGEKDKAKEILPQAREAAGEGDDLFNKSFQLRHILEVYLEMGERDKADEILAEMAKIAEESKPPQYALLSLVRGYTKTRRYDEAFTIAQKLPDDFLLKARVLRDITRGCVETGNRDKAIEITGKAYKMAKVIQDSALRGEELIAIADMEAEVGEKDKAKKNLSEALSLTEKIKDSWNKTMAFIWIATVYEEMGEKEKALDALRRASASTGELPSFTGKEICDVYLRLGAYDEAYKVIKRVSNDATKVEVITEIANKYAEAGKKDKASDLFYRALKIARRIEYPDEQIKALVAIDGAYRKAGLAFEKKGKKVLVKILNDLKKK